MNLPSFVVLVAMALCLVGNATRCIADLIENFTFGNGNITTVSGGAWQLWEAGSGNGTIVSGTMRYDGTTDVMRTFPPVLTGPGTFATISFTINVNIADSTEAYALDFLPASAPFNGNTNYGNQFSLGFDYENVLNQGDGKASIDVAEGAGGGNSTSFRVGSVLTQGVTHAIRVAMARGTSYTTYDLYLDSVILRSGSFLLTDSRGMNAVELEQTSSDGSVTPSATAFALVDNLAIVPELSAGTLFFFGAAGLSMVRRCQKGRARKK